MAFDPYLAQRRMERFLPGLAEENHARATLSTNELAMFYQDKTARDQQDYSPGEGKVIATITFRPEKRKVEIRREDTGEFFYQ